MPAYEVSAKPLVVKLISDDSQESEIVNILPEIPVFHFDSSNLRFNRDDIHLENFQIDFS